MQLYKYKGYDAGGNKVDGQISANSIEEVERRVAAQEVTVIAIVPAGMRKGTINEDGEVATARPRKRVSDGDAALILQNLSIMAETGVPFIEAIEAVAASARTPKIGEALADLKTDVVGGKSLSAAMRAASYLFPPIVADMVKVAEEGGRLDHALRSAGIYLERAADLRKRVINAMLYPMVMMFVSAITITILILFVMPKFGAIFDKMGGQLPITTRFLLAMGKYVRANPMLFLGEVAGFATTAFFVLRTRTASAWGAKAMLRVPVLGDLLKKLSLSRAFQSISTLLSSNVALMSALEHGAKVAGNSTISNALTFARNEVENGRSLSECLAETKVFPPMLIQMVAVGERTGRMSALLSTVSANMESEVDSKLKALVAIIEPVMIVFMGVIVGTITVSIIAPIYSVIENIK